MNTMKVEGSTGVVYTISVNGAGAAQCSCPAHRYNRATPCKHMLQALLTLQVQAKPLRHLRLVK